MHRRTFLKGVALAGAGAFAAPMLNLGRVRLFAADDRRWSIRAVELVERTTVVDMLGLLTLDWPRLARWQRDETAFGDDEFRHLRASGIDVFHPAVDPNEPDAPAAVRRWLARWNHMLAAHPEYFVRVGSVAAMDRARAEGRIGLLLGFQTSDHFVEPADVERYYRLGQRVSQLTYDRHNRLGSGCREATDRGLTALGAEVIAEMNRVGMVVDVSHCGERTTLDAFDASCKPVLVTHANCAALVPGHPRCKSDRVLRAMAVRGGVIGITAVRAYVRQPGTPTLDDLLDHFEHVARVAGVEHVGLGSDVDVDGRDPRTGLPRPAYAIRGLDHARRTFDVAEGLLRRGWREDDVALVLGGNFRRALAEIWSVAPGQQVPLPPERPPVVPPLVLAG